VHYPGSDRYGGLGQAQGERTWNNQEEVTVKGLHFLQENSPDDIGQAVAAFVKKLS